MYIYIYTCVVVCMCMCIRIYSYSIDSLVPLNRLRKFPADGRKLCVLTQVVPVWFTGSEVLSHHRPESTNPIGSAQSISAAWARLVECSRLRVKRLTQHPGHASNCMRTESVSEHFASRLNCTNACIPPYVGLPTKSVGSPHKWGYSHIWMNARLKGGVS